MDEKKYNLNSDLLNAQDNNEADNNKAYETLLKEKNFEALLPESFQLLVESFIYSDCLDVMADEFVEYCMEEDRDWTVNEILMGYSALDDYGINLMYNYETIKQNDDFLKLCKFYYDDDEEFNNKYIAENGEFNLRGFCNDTCFNSDVMNDLSEQAFDGEDFDNRIKEIRESHKKDEQRYYAIKYEGYTSDELKEALEETYRQPIFANSYEDEELQFDILLLNQEAIENAIEKIEGKEE